MTDWIKHTTGTCPVDPETVVEVKRRYAVKAVPPRLANQHAWGWGSPYPITHYRIVTPRRPAPGA